MKEQTPIEELINRLEKTIEFYSREYWQEVKQEIEKL